MSSGEVLAKARGSRFYDVALSLNSHIGFVVPNRPQCHVGLVVAYLGFYYL